MVVVIMVLVLVEFLIAVKMLLVPAVKVVGITEIKVMAKLVVVNLVWWL